MFQSNVFVRVTLFTLGILSGGILIVAATLIGVFGSSKPAEQAAAMPPPPPPTMIVVAAKPIPTGTLIVPQLLRFAAVEPKALTAGDFVRPVALNSAEQQAADQGIFKQITGGVARARFDEGNPILRGQMVKPGDAGFLAAVLRPGMRAVTMSVNMVSGEAGLLFPGDHVDVVLTQTFAGHDADPGHRSMTQIIATDLRVIAVDQRMIAGGELQKEMRPAQTVTLEVTAVQTEELQLGAKMGDLALAIRGVQDDAAPGGEAAAAEPIPIALWAKDLSPGTAILTPRNGPPAAKQTVHAEHGEEPQLRIYRGDKIDSVSAR